ncbi:MAG TPA: hypothetical protein VM532_05725 [Burkholderiales bacterium]|nr:hypothetical protein [Burkholderiales bacterium]
MSDVYYSSLIQNIIANPEAINEASKAAGLDARSRRAIAREELRLVDQLDKQDRYPAIRAFLLALGQMQSGSSDAPNDVA